MADGAPFSSEWKEKILVQRGHRLKGSAQQSAAFLSPECSPRNIARRNPVSANGFGSRHMHEKNHQPKKEKFFRPRTYLLAKGQDTLIFSICLGSTDCASEYLKCILGS